MRWASDSVGGEVRKYTRLVTNGTDAATNQNSIAVLKVNMRPGTSNKMDRENTMYPSQHCATKARSGASSGRRLAYMQGSNAAGARERAEDITVASTDAYGLQTSSLPGFTPQLFGNARPPPFCRIRRSALDARASDTICCPLLSRRHPAVRSAKLPGSR